MTGDIRDPENKFAWVQQQIRRAFQPIREQPTTSISVENFRSAFDAFSALVAQPHDTTITTFTINGLPAEWIFPTAPIPERVILYFHGGTYINGSLKTDRTLASILANVTQTKVLQVAYRIAPEYPFPTAIYDGLAAYHWLMAHSHSPRHIALVGSAAGGGIALAVLRLLRDQGSSLPVVVACLSPWTDLTTEGLTAKRHISTDIVLNASLLGYAASHYVRSEQAALALASPLHADLHGLPPLFLQVGQHEILYEDTCKLAERARTYHVRAHCITWENMFHGWHAFASVLPEGRLAFEQIAAYFEHCFALARKD